MCKVSVIVPCYGVEAYLDRCMASLLTQTLDDIEIIMVDDGSPDRVPFMCDDYAKKDSRIKIIHKENDKLTLITENIELFFSLMEDFLLKNPAQIKSSSKLAEYMAMHARTIRSIITGILKSDENGQPLATDSQKSIPMFIELYGLYNRIKKDLRPAMDDSV